MSLKCISILESGGNNSTQLTRVKKMPVKYLAQWSVHNQHPRYSCLLYYLVSLCLVGSRKGSSHPLTLTVYQVTRRAEKAPKSRGGNWGGLPERKGSVFLSGRMLSCFSHVQLFAPTRLLSRGILQAGILGWAARPSSRGSSRPRD